METPYRLPVKESDVHFGWLLNDVGDALVAVVKDDSDDNVSTLKKILFRMWNPKSPVYHFGSLIFESDLRATGEKSEQEGQCWLVSNLEVIPPVHHTAVSSSLQ